MIVTGVLIVCYRCVEGVPVIHAVAGCVCKYMYVCVCVCVCANMALKRKNDKIIKIMKNDKIIKIMKNDKIIKIIKNDEDGLQ